MRRRSKIVALFTMFFMILGLVLMSSSGLVAKILNKTVATVNGKIILMSDFEKKFEPVKKELEKAGIKSGEISDYQEKVLDEMINEILIMQEAEDKKVYVTRKQVSDEIEKWKSMYPDLDKELKNRNITILELEDELEKGLVANKLFQTVVMGEVLQPTEEEIDKFYKENKEDVHKLLSEYIFRQKAEKHQEKWLKNLRDKASIIKNDIE